MTNPSPNPLRALREAHELSRRALADTANIHRSTVTYYEAMPTLTGTHGERNTATLGVLVRIARALGESITLKIGPYEVDLGETK